MYISRIPEFVIHIANSGLNSKTAFHSRGTAVIEHVEQAFKSSHWLRCLRRVAASGVNERLHLERGRQTHNMEHHVDRRTRVVLIVSVPDVMRLLVQREVS